MMSQGKSMDDYGALDPLGQVPFHMQLAKMLKDDITRSYSRGAEEAGMKDWRERAAGSGPVGMFGRRLPNRETHETTLARQTLMRDLSEF